MKFTTLVSIHTFTPRQCERSVPMAHHPDLMQGGRLPKSQNKNELLANTTNFVYDDCMQFYRESNLISASGIAEVNP
jgi:hypothetical protein